MGMKMKEARVKQTSVQESRGAKGGQDNMRKHGLQRWARIRGKSCGAGTGSKTNGIRMIWWINEISVVKQGMQNETRMQNRESGNKDVKQRREKLMRHETQQIEENKNKKVTRQKS